MTVEDRLTAIEVALNTINMTNLSELLPQDESYKLKEKLIFLEEQAQSEFKGVKEQMQVTIDALKEINKQAEERDKTLQEHTNKLQEEIKTMQDVGNTYAKDLVEAEQLKLSQKYVTLNQQFTAVNEEFRNTQSRVTSKSSETRSGRNKPQHISGKHWNEVTPSNQSLNKVKGVKERPKITLLR